MKRSPPTCATPNLQASVHNVSEKSTNDSAEPHTPTNPVRPRQTLRVVLLSDRWSDEQTSSHGRFLGMVAKNALRLLVDMSVVCVSLPELGGAQRDEIRDTDPSRPGHPGPGESKLFGCTSG